MSSPHRRLRVIKPGRAAIRIVGQAATENELRALFASERILDRVQSGELTETVIKSSHPSPPQANEPECTLSQLLAYTDSGGKKLAEAHRYLRTDGKIGASGLPDPKQMNHNGTLYYIDR